MTSARGIRRPSQGRGLDAGLREQQEFSGQRRRKGISGRKNSMCAQRQRVVEASGVFWNLWESGCLCGHMGCGARWAWLRLTQMSWD